MKIYNILNLGTTGKITLTITSALSILVPIKVLAIVVLVFVAVDFTVGLIVSKKKRKQGFVTEKAWDTIWKIIGAEVCIVLAWVLDTHVLNFAPDLFLANIFAGFICGADLWSILTNFAILSNHPVFRLIKKWGKSEIENKIGLDISELDNDIIKN